MRAPHTLPLSRSGRDAVLYYNRKHRRDRVDVIAGLGLTHSIEPEQSGLVTADLFPDTSRPATFATRIETVTGAPTGVLFNFGSAALGTGIVIIGQNISFRSGPATGGVAEVVNIPQMGQIGFRPEFMFAVNPGLGKARAWMNGAPLFSVDTGSAWTGWSDAGVGTTAPAGTFRMVSKLRVAYGKLPRGF